MQFLNPIWLWGLTGLMIPIGIHLLSRKEGKVIRIGSIRHLEETSTKQFRNIRLNEFLLLALRCLLITLIVFLLSGITFTKSKTKEVNWLLIEKGLEKENDFKNLIDSLEKKEFELRWLAKDFPLLKDSSSVNASINYWTLVESLKAHPAKQIVVLAYNYTNQFKGKRRSIPEHVQWISKNSIDAEFTLNATRISSDSVLVRKGKTSFERTSFSNQYLKASPGQSVLVEDNSMRITSKDTISITLYNDPSFEYDKEIILAALKAIDQTMPCVFRISTLPAEKWTDDDNTAWIIWLSEKVIPEKGNSKRIVYLKNEIEPNELLTPSASGWFLNDRLDEENSLNENLTVQLADILLKKKQVLQRAKHFDKRALPEKLLWSSTSSIGSEASVALVGTSNILNYLAIFILLTLLVERVVAFKRNQ